MPPCSAVDPPEPAFADDELTVVANFTWVGSELLPRLQALPGFDNEAFIRAMGVSEEGVSVLWRR